MAQAPIQPHLIPTTNKVLMSDWQSLKKYIEKNTQLVKTNQHSETTPFGLLSDQQINDALAGAWQLFFKLKCSAYATIAKVRLMLTITQDDSFKDNKNNYPKDALKKISTAELDKMQSALDTQMDEHYEQWERLIQHWQQQLIKALTAQDIQLSDIEIKEFKDLEPMSELYNRFIDLHLEISKPDILSFSEYFRFKAQLAIHSSLNRRHLAHEHHEVNKVFKKLKNDFSTIDKEETSLLNTQRADTHQIIAPLKEITVRADVVLHKGK